MNTKPIKRWLRELSRKKLQGFSMAEMMLVIVIMGILLLLIVPNMTGLVTKAKSTEAKMQLQHLYSLQKNHFYEFSKYAGNLADLGFEQERLVSDGGQANYRIEIVEASQTTFLARATSVTDFNGNGTFNVWEIDEGKQLSETVKD